MINKTSNRRKIDVLRFVVDACRLQYVRDSYQSHFCFALMRQPHDSEEEGKRIPTDPVCGPCALQRV